MKIKVLKTMVAMLLSVSLLLSFAACGSESEENDSANAKKYDTDSESMQDAELGNIKVGDYIAFGKYEQDNNTSNGKEEIEWLVLEVKDGKALVISKYGLDAKPYNEEDTDVTWETCTLRSWLNNDFINIAFSSAEKSKIPTVTVSSDSNPKYSTNPGNATQDKVFLFSINEVSGYLTSRKIRQCQASDYAVANGAYISEWQGYEGKCQWWLRSPGSEQDEAANIFTDGDCIELGQYVYYTHYAVRPAMWINL